MDLQIPMDVSGAFGLRWRSPSSSPAFLLLLSCFPSLSFSFSMRIKREERDGEGERGSFCQRVGQFPMLVCVASPTQDVTDAAQRRVAE